MTITYYKEILPVLVDKYKVVIGQCLAIIEQKIDSSISDDKLHNVLRSKRMASEDVKYYARQIDILESEINGVVGDQGQYVEGVSPLKKFTKK